MLRHPRQLEAERRTLQWNKKRAEFLQHLVNGESRKLKGTPKATYKKHTYYLISRHASGLNSAYVTASKLRQLWPTLEFKVAKAEDKPWTTEIWARRHD